MAGANKNVSLSGLYADLNKHGANGDYDRALKVCNRLLHEFPDEEKAFQCKLVCLIQTSKFQEAIQALGKSQKFSGEFAFEKAYCQYRLNQPKEALDTIDSAGSLDQKLKELKAQVLYRLEDYEACFDVYRDLIKTNADDFEDERETNLAAVVANLSIEGTKRDLPTLRESTYELLYNSACRLLGTGQVLEAEKKLKQSEKMCRESLEEEGSTEEDIEDELSIVKVQLAFCLHKMGREKEAQVIYNRALKQKPDDIALVAITSNNLAVLNREGNLFDSKKRLKSATVDGLEHKLTQRQRRAIAVNQCLLAALTGQAEQCAAMCDKVAKQYASTKEELVLVRATALARDGKVADAGKLLNDESKQAPKRRLELQLAAVQMHLAEGDTKAACDILKNMGDSTFSPGIVSALVTLYLASSDRKSASTVLKDAVEWYRKNKTGSQSSLSMLWRKAADFHLRGGEPQVAARSLEELLKINPSDMKTLAQLVIAYAQFDPKKAQELSKKLPPVGELAQDTDIDALETSSWVMGTKVMKKVTAKVEASPMTGENLLRKKRRKRPGKLPKNYIAGATPDPERWLPRYERSGYKKKKDRRVKEQLKGSQGTAYGASEQFDMSARVPVAKSSPQTPATPDQGPRSYQKKQTKKKKGKGGKW
ncbi:signal recognition particle subunit SRP72 [Cloeon dipterum]|uniref:signal recognition particle subunit SRP72 n=1 Tax=Cloeon dipterum TaxID=197152 RepID=UPI0032208515